MKNKIVLLILIVISLFTLVSCGDKEAVTEVIPNQNITNNDGDNNQGGNTETPNSPSLVVEVYTVTWVNYDGTVLETDEAVEEGSIPIYNGLTPEKEGEVKYIFSGWNPEVSVVTCDVTYTATFIEVEESDILGATPILSMDKKTLTNLSLLKKHQQPNFQKQFQIYL